MSLLNITKNAINSSKETILNTAVQVGTAALSMMDPDNFEYYLCSLELIDYKKNQIGFLAFNVMPNNISESETPIQSMTKTKNGIVTVFNDSFNPVMITIQGTFGKRLRIVTDVVNPNENTGFLGNLGKVAGVSTGIKSGYGLTKVMQYILKTSTKVDKDGHPYLLIFKNYAFNTAYVVDLISQSYNQSIDNNMMWFYEIQLRGVAPESAVKTKSKNDLTLLKTVASNSIAQGLGNIISDVKQAKIFNYG